ncbi:MAG: hypothetical protein A2X28_00365 [Elusimicrobia bacterium GWA2_56_46]|nr:MAG: hypothetical protein A2X28_00365 [Elusimicrobia bacterium GWA2_56_46]OGR55821.1 MAG: hypothetical protein A2X39_05740 [Elusimicrobia bacterium GWC2_56_31]HBB65834.1 hypothetical protein [Elusimicrobiota bacterium]HBW22247.1 hypothetical protein [Elusimicrobiota bacterium]
MYLPVVSLLLLAYLAFLLTGIVREDILCGKIKNQELISGAKAVLAAVCCFLAVSVAAIEFRLKGVYFEPCFGYPYYMALLENAAAGLAAGVVLWKAGVWPAGDAKLYALVCAAVPIMIPYAGWSPAFLFLSLLVNIFLPAAAVYLIQMSREQFGLIFSESAGLARKKIFDGLSAAAAGLWANPGGIVLFLFTMLVFSFVGAWNSAQTGAFRINDKLFFVLLLAFGGRAGEYAEKAGVRIMLLSFGAIAVCAALFPGFLGLTRIVMYGLVKSAQFMAFRWLLYMVADRHLSSCGTYRVSLEQLAPGMVVSGEYMEQLRRAEPGFLEECGFDKYRDGLTAGQVGRLHLLLKNKSRDSRDEVGVPVFRVKPFAFWIGMGGALTVALSGNHVLMAAQLWFRRLLGAI